MSNSTNQLLGALPVLFFTLFLLMAAASAYYFFFVPEESPDERDGPPVGLMLLGATCALGVAFAVICEMVKR